MRRDIAKFIPGWRSKYAAAHGVGVAGKSPKPASCYCGPSGAKCLPCLLAEPAEAIQTLPPLRAGRFEGEFGDGHPPTQDLGACTQTDGGSSPSSSPSSSDSDDSGAGGERQQGPAAGDGPAFTLALALVAAAVLLVPAAAEAEANRTVGAAGDARRTCKPCPACGGQPSIVLLPLWLMQATCERCNWHYSVWYPCWGLPIVRASGTMQGDLPPPRPGRFKGLDKCTYDRTEAGQCS